MVFDLFIYNFITKSNSVARAQRKKRLWGEAPRA